MNKILNVQSDKIMKLFISYLIPALTAGIITSAYIIVDGIFIGKGIGSQGLAAVGLVVPMFTMFSGLSLVFAIGGSTMSSIAIARKETDEANKYFTHSIIAISLIMALFTITILLFREPILVAFGAEGELLQLSSTYLKIMILFGVPYALALVLAAFVRIEGFPKLAMGATVIGAVINVVFDYMFIFEFNMGIFGAALATGMGNIVATIILLAFFLKKKGQLQFVLSSPTQKIYKSIVSIGLPSFLSQALFSLALVAYNLRLLQLVGETAVSAYSAVGFLMPLLMMIALGIGQAIQPIISANYGSGQLKRAEEALAIGLKASILINIVLLLISIVFNEKIISLFITSADPAFEIASDALVYYFVSYVFVGFVMVLSSYFQSIEEPQYALYLSLFRGLIIIFPAMYIMSNVWGVKGMWYAALFTEVVTAFIALHYKLKQSNSFNKTKDNRVDAVF